MRGVEKGMYFGGNVYSFIFLVTHKASDAST